MAVAAITKFSTLFLPFAPFCTLLVPSLFPLLLTFLVLLPFLVEFLSIPLAPVVLVVWLVIVIVEFLVEVALWLVEFLVLLSSAASALVLCIIEEFVWFLPVESEIPCREEELEEELWGTELVYKPLAE